MADESTTTRPPIALRTIFSPPPSCLSTITYDGTTAWQNGIGQTGDPDCYPASFADILYSWYSPGICPSQWTQAQIVTATSNPVTVAYCCPSNYSLYRTSAKVLLANYCYSNLNTAVSNVASVPRLTGGPLPTSVNLVTLQPSKAANTIVYADVIQVHWASSNTRIISLLSDKASAASAASTVSSAATTAISETIGAAITSPSSPSSPISNPSSTTSSALSSGAKAGIGIGVALGIIAIFGVAACVLFRRRRRRTGQPYSAAAVDEADNPSYPGHVEELDQDGKPVEIGPPVGKKVAELDTPRDKGGKVGPSGDSTRPIEMEAWEAPEMPGPKIAAELGSQE